MNDCKSSSEIYFDSFGLPGSKRRLPAALAAGRNRSGDYELRLGYYLGRQEEGQAG